MSKAIFIEGSGELLRHGNRVSLQARIRRFAVRGTDREFRELERIFSNLRRLRMKG